MRGGRRRRGWTRGVGQPRGGGGVSLHSSTTKRARRESRPSRSQRVASGDAWESSASGSGASARMSARCTASATKNHSSWRNGRLSTRLTCRRMSFVSFARALAAARSSCTGLMYASRACAGEREGARGDELKTARSRTGVVGSDMFSRTDDDARGRARALQGGGKTTTTTSSL